MASAIFEGTSLVNMFVKDCWVNGIRRLIIRGEEEEFFEIRTEWSDRNILYLHRSSSDLGRLLKRLLECFPEDRRDLLKSPLIEGLVKIKEARDIETKLNEVERLLKNTINMPWKFSRSEVVLTFFERSQLDQVLRNDSVHKIQPCFQSPVKISVSPALVQMKVTTGALERQQQNNPPKGNGFAEIMRSNGFCLANTETIVFDESIPLDKERPSSTDSAQHSYDEDGRESLDPVDQDLSDDDPEAYVTNLSYYHLVPFETDILE
ncbi:PX domain-containing protein 1-like isoform X1 [Sinocyclocheilus rhinocerous]|uniref:PX domain-containing protein 1-like isoform X1 n=1 Tax=Sinocyclocheilus rhinocerous TaxID=307959 RepID=UPI0007B877DD|nr:PREDICTED: PX domain-containing protein 1-like isoform X1 [Sinocyclocheilus rhinocerous]